MTYSCMLNKSSHICWFSAHVCSYLPDFRSAACFCSRVILRLLVVVYRPLSSFSNPRASAASINDSDLLTSRSSFCGSLNITAFLLLQLSCCREADAFIQHISPRGTELLHRALKGPTNSEKTIKREQAHKIKPIKQHNTALTAETETK